MIEEIQKVIHFFEEKVKENEHLNVETDESGTDCHFNSEDDWSSLPIIERHVATVNDKDQNHDVSNLWRKDLILNRNDIKFEQRMDSELAKIISSLNLGIVSKRNYELDGDGVLFYVINKDTFAIDN